jgi:hypothetical protein
VTGSDVAVAAVQRNAIAAMMSVLARVISLFVSANGAWFEAPVHAWTLDEVIRLID